MLRPFEQAKIVSWSASRAGDAYVKLRRARNGNRWALLLLCLSLPLSMGGCENFRNDVVDAFEVATRGLVDAVLNAAFDSLRSGQGP